MGRFIYSKVIFDVKMMVTWLAHAVEDLLLWKDQVKSGAVFGGAFGYDVQIGSLVSAFVFIPKHMDPCSDVLGSE